MVLGIKRNHKIKRIALNKEFLVFKKKLKKSPIRAKNIFKDIQDRLPSSRGIG